MEGLQTIVVADLVHPGGRLTVIETQIAGVPPGDGFVPHEALGEGPRLDRALRQAAAQAKQTSAQIRQCACISAWLLHSSPQRWQISAQASRMRPHIGPAARGGARNDARCCRAYVGAIQIETNAAAKLRHHLLAEAGIGAEEAGLGAIPTGLDAGDERGIGASLMLRVGFDHGLGVHSFLRLRSAAGAAGFNDHKAGGFPVAIHGNRRAAARLSVQKVSYGGSDGHAE